MLKKTINDLIGIFDKVRRTQGRYQRDVNSDDVMSFINLLSLKTYGYIAMTEAMTMKVNEETSLRKPIIEHIMAIKEASLEALKAEYAALFGQASPCSNNKAFLLRKIAYRLQEIEYGGLSADIQSRISELIDRYDPVNNKILRPQNSSAKEKASKRDTRLPIPGAIIRKEYKGKVLEVKVLEKGFEYQSQVYRTLSAVAKVVTGDHWNGYLFFKP